ncbi:hypothetical protein NDU88_003429 [Pleurodeles waltl]|uniref:Uncharacterized protein n=1 Tax=Pleurodeles waltl TaxID=8319 RepID=A0AAV7LFT4_PLEWA|nr:hypothetical protein NDU88_003429 [Pleurodeles waltl]
MFFPHRVVRRTRKVTGCINIASVRTRSLGIDAAGRAHREYDTSHWPCYGPMRRVQAPICKGAIPLKATLSDGREASTDFPWLHERTQ